MTLKKIEHNKDINNGFKEGRKVLQEALKNEDHLSRALMELGVNAGNAMEPNALLDYMYGARLAFWGENDENYPYAEEDLESDEE